MIRYALVCDQRHNFEAWFQSSADYDKQAKRALVSCPTCSSTKIEKAIMAPSIGRAGKSEGHTIVANELPATPLAPAAPVAMLPPQEREMRKKLKDLRDHLIKNADNVGQKFPEEARKMHYGEIEHRSIYGEASPQDAKELYEEGIDFHPLPALPDERN
jgi:hypothetical protein